MTRARKADKPAAEPNPAILAGFRVTRYTFDIDQRSAITVEERMGVEPPTDYARGRPVRRWAVCGDGGVWTSDRDGFEFEPLASGRDEAFIRRARWATLEEAFAEACLAVTWKKTQRERMMATR